MFDDSGLDIEERWTSQGSGLVHRWSLGYSKNQEEVWLVEDSDSFASSKYRSVRGVLL